MTTASLVGTKWRCIVENMDEFGMTCEIIEGEYDPNWNGDNDIKIRYEDGSTAYMKFRRFIFRFKTITN